MAVENNNKNKHPRNAGGSRRGAPRPLRIFVGIVAGIFVLLMFFGVINQARTGQTLMSYFISVGKDVGQQITYTFSGDDRAPVEITDEGVYAQGHAPDTATELADK